MASYDSIYNIHTETQVGSNYASTPKYQPNLLLSLIVTRPFIFIYFLLLTFLYRDFNTVQNLRGTELHFQWQMYN